MFNFKNTIWLLLSCGILGCSEPEVIIPPFEVPTSGKTVLVEELTGVRCPNCPSAAARLEAVQEIYGNQVVLINIHGNLLTSPLSESQYDFRNSFSTALEEQHKPLVGKPSVVINRKKHPSFSLVANPLQDQWQSIIEEELQSPQTVNILADILTNDQGWQVKTAITPLVDIDEELALHVYLVENNIIDAQEDVNRIIEDYRHDHVLRYAITPLDGQLLSTSIQQNEIINTDINIPGDIIGNDWEVNNLEVVLFITDESGAVAQAINVHLIP